MSLSDAVPGGWLPLGSNTHLPVRVGPPFNAARAAGVTTRLHHPLTGAPRTLRLVFANWMNDGGRDAPGPTALTLGATVETAGDPRAVRFAGLPEVTLMPGQALVSDPLDLGAAADSITTTTRVRPTSGGPVPLGPEADTTAGESVQALLPDGTREALRHGFGPCQILGVPTRDHHPEHVLVVGDSNAVGFGDRRGSAEHLGWARRLFDGRRLAVNASTSGATAAAALAEGPSLRRAQLTAATVPGLAVVALGTNDLQRGGDLAAVQAALQSLWRVLSDEGWRIAAVTVPPVTESSDDWATGDSQAPTAGHRERVALNEWLRRCPDLVDEVWDLAEVVAAGSTRWRPGMTHDGVHLSPQGHAAVAHRFAGHLR